MAQNPVETQKSIDFVQNLKDWASKNFPEAILGVLGALVMVLLLWIVYRVTRFLILRALQNAKRTDSQIRQFTTMWKYLFLLIGIVMMIVSMSGSLAAMGLTVAFVSMILGWSLQRPVTGVAAWLMVMIKRPFVIGDRIIIQGVRGDVLDITPTHILLGEVGGTIGGEESSNRGILIPNAVLFDQMVINYAVSEESKYILDEVPVRVSYDSNISKAEQTLIACAQEATESIIKETGKQPVVRSSFFESGVMMRLQYQTVAVERQKISSEIVGRVLKAFAQESDLGFAYAHTVIDHRQARGPVLPPAQLSTTS